MGNDQRPGVRIRSALEVEFIPGTGVFDGFCPPDCVCGGRLTRDECDRRLSLLWNAILDRFAVERLIRHAS
jgi:hypothetical protein